jgi:hypothetical protein
VLEGAVRKIITGADFFLPSKHKSGMLKKDGNE